jgi:hypothetical protein
MVAPRPFFPVITLLLALMLALVLAACGAEPVQQDGEPLDPVMTEALEGQLLVDTDLTQQNMQNMAVVPGGPIDPALPFPDPPKN